MMSVSAPQLPLYTLALSMPVDASLGPYPLGTAVRVAVCPLPPAFGIVKSNSALMVGSHTYGVMYARILSPVGCDAAGCDAAGCDSAVVGDASATVVAASAWDPRARAKPAVS